MKTTHSLILAVVIFVAGLVLGLLLSRSEAVDSPQALMSTTVELSNTDLIPAAPMVVQAMPDETTGALVVNTDETELLQQRIRQLELQLEQQQRLDVDQELSEQQGAVETEAVSQDTNISPEQAQTFLPEPFASLIAKQTGQAVEYLNQHQAEEVDSQWAYELELKITDHFATHEHANQVKLSSVSCKTSICEIRGYEYEPNRFIVVYNAMQTQNWWRYSSSYAFQGSNEQGAYFYLLAELKR